MKTIKANIVNFGPVASGKSYSLRTLLPEYPDKSGKIHKGAGLETRLLSCDPGWSATNSDLTCEMGFHVKEVLPANPSWQVRIRWLEKISNLDGEQIKKMSVPESIWSGYRQFMDLHVACVKFVCDRCGKDFGCVDDWDQNVAFINDGLSGMTKMAKHFAVGPKPSLTWPDIDKAGHTLEDYIDKCVSLNCNYIMIAHWDKEPNNIEGGTNITLDTIGNKVAPRLIKIFDEIILSVRVGDVYTWNLAADGVQQKTRRLEYKSGLSPNFSQIFRKDI